MTLHSDTMPFFHELMENNNRDWFQANKLRWEEIKRDFLIFTQAVIDELIPLDPSLGNPKAQQCMYRINRDTRFSPDKSPYKTHISFFIPTGGVKRPGVPGYYIQMDANPESEGCFMGGGVFMPDSATLAAIRQEIFYNTDSFKSLLSHPDFHQWFPGGIWTTQKLKLVPKGFPKDWPDNDLLKYKDYTTMHYFDESLASSDKLLEQTLACFCAVAPLNKFLQQAMGL